MIEFHDKQEVFDYVIKKFSKKNKLILIRGSTAKKPVKNFSDFDIEIWTNKLEKPYYEIAFVSGKIVLISIYFYKYKLGKKVDVPSNVKILFGEYNDQIIPDFSNDKYTNKEKIKRECQLLVDFFFKYLRRKDKKYLSSVQKRI